MKLYDFQKDGIGFMLDTPYCLNACEMGLGKSLQSLEAARRAKAQDIAIFCPAFLQANWKAEIEKHYGVRTPFKFKLFPYSTLTKVKASTAEMFDTWICDEAHYLKNYKAKRTDHFHSLIEHSRPERLYLLSGTPIKNRIPEFWTLLTFMSIGRGQNGSLFRARFPNEWTFANYFCNKETLYFGSKKIQKFYGYRKDRVNELKAIFSQYMFRRRQKDVLDLPPVLHKNVFLGLPEDPALRKEFDDFLSGKPTPDSSNKALSARLKAPLTVDYVKSIIEEGQGPVLVFTDHIDSAEIIAEGLKVAAITGKTPIQKRQSLISEFTNRESSVLVTTIGTGSVGYNLTVSTHCVFNDRSWVPADNLQAEKRVHRIGQDQRVIIHNMLAGPLDSFINHKVSEKLEIIREAGI